MYTLYLLLCKDDSIYTGITTDLERRLAEHRTGQGSKYVRARGAKKILYTERFTTRSKASKREVEIKKLRRQEKIAMIRA